MRISMLLLALLLAGSAHAKPWWMRGVESNENDYLPPDVAFRVGAAIDDNVFRVRWIIADGYYLYRSKIEIKPESPDLTVAAADLPPGHVKVDPYFGNQEIYRQQVTATAAYTRLDAGAHPLQIKVTYQGCADAGLCYPPITKLIFPQHSLPVAATAPRPMVGAAILGGVFAFLLAGLLLRKDRKLDLPRGMNARLAAGALLAVLGIAAGAVVHFSRGTVESRQEVRVAAGRASAPGARDVEAGPEVAGALPARKIPDRLPQFSLQDPSGKPTSIGSFADKSLIINFWATWCAPCRSEIPLLETLHAEWADRGVTVVGIAVDHREAVLEFAKRLKIGYPLLIGEQDALDAAAALGVESPVFPFTVFTDRRGEVVALYIGELHKPQAELILSQVQSLNQGQIELAAARHAITTGLSSLAAGAST